MEKLLTIVVPAYNVEKYIKNCLDSFIDLSVLRSLEILIVDDGSTDSTASQSSPSTTLKYFPVARGIA